MSCLVAFFFEPPSASQNPKHETASYAMLPLLNFPVAPTLFFLWPKSHPASCPPGLRRFTSECRQYPPVVIGSTIHPLTLRVRAFADWRSCGLVGVGHFLPTGRVHVGVRAHLGVSPISASGQWLNRLSSDPKLSSLTPNRFVSS